MNKLDPTILETHGNLLVVFLDDLQPVDARRLWDRTRLWGRLYIDGRRAVKYDAYESWFHRVESRKL